MERGNPRGHTAACPRISSLLVLIFPGPLEDIHPACAHVETPLREPFSRCYKEDVSLMQTHLGAAEEGCSFSNLSNSGSGGILSAGAGEALQEEDRAARRAWGKSRAPDSSFQGPESQPPAAWGAKLAAGSVGTARRSALGGTQVTRLVGSNSKSGNIRGQQGGRLPSLP